MHKIIIKNHQLKIDLFERIIKIVFILFTTQPKILYYSLLKDYLKDESSFLAKLEGCFTSRIRVALICSLYTTNELYITNHV